MLFARLPAVPITGFSHLCGILAFRDLARSADDDDLFLCSFVSFAVEAFALPLTRHVGDPARFDLYLLVSQTDGGAADKPPSTRI
jgi:hypothetical protein